MALASAAAAVLGGMYLDAKYAIRNDLTHFRAVGTAIINHLRVERQDKIHLYYHFRDKAKSMPNRVFLIFEGRAYTYRQLELSSNRLAHWLLSQNVKPKDIICMMEQNHPTFYIALWAIMKIGAIPSLINTNLQEDPLLHCLTIADTRIFLFDPMYESQVATIAEAARAAGVSLYAYGEATEFDSSTTSSLGPALTPEALAPYPDIDTDEALIKGVGVSDAAWLIYTSGTTGLPKAAVVQHARLNGVIFGSTVLSGITKDDVSYCCLPLYHSSACATLVVARKFSVTKFWDDVYNNNYIGELCRYLMNRDPHPHERDHKLHTCFGNGMPPEIWKQFRERFNVQKICEFYGATEGPGGLFNLNVNDHGAGAVGYFGPLLRGLLRSEVKIIKIDPISEEPIRDKNGFCIQCAYDDPGEMIIGMQGQGGRARFDGYYKNSKATSKKILVDALKKGDIYFRTGDLLKMNSEGMYYFLDRLGDTFRWHSENVATTEVSQVIGKYPAVAETNVFGVKVPSHVGRAGMVALILRPNTTLDFADFYQYLSKHLPKYAVPLFIRFVPSMNITGTFKQQKVLFRDQGIDKVPDDQQPIYWLKGNTYVPFTAEDYAKVSTGKVKL
ncbi:hypothetical protein BDB00DRAFT_933901 [Zychaea mexicana]|uniref:uncharacterized protein n=1 Tax=Zychaea mexicana TaxID=64656 RepID=UPI0022FDBD7F|nr:uncharacterized protein BDB00DRAFT_933901 [Zychaea mexicana]KAI9482512.1 hypothetical protein BDB00DRAFT_933901 [Zychaea mexicana]